MKATILFSLISLLVAKEAVCYDESGAMTLKDLPQGILQELLVLLKGQKLVETVECINPRPDDIDLLLYTRNNKNDAEVLDFDGPSPIGGDKRLILVIHGWIQSGDGYGMQELKDAYLDRYDCNVIVVNWQKLAMDLYSRSVCTLPKIGKIIASYLVRVSEENGLDLGDVQIVGHSLGGQMAGYIGYSTQQSSGKSIGRITGLDPAGPLFYGAPTSKRLDPTDADFVDVMHTNSKVFGYYDPCGHADFYVSCGIYQPSCTGIDINVKGMLTLPVNTVCCSHMRAVDYMIEGVKTNNFKATKCDYCPLGCPPVINMIKNTGKATLGQQCSPSTRGKYYVPVDIKSPYAITAQWGQ